MHIPNLNKNSVIAIDDCYHNVQIKPPLTSLTKKGDMINWLVNNDIPCSPSVNTLYIVLAQTQSAQRLSLIHI